MVFRTPPSSSGRDRRGSVTSKRAENTEALNGLSHANCLGHLLLACQRNSMAGEKPLRLIFISQHLFDVTCKLRYRILCRYRVPGTGIILYAGINLPYLRFYVPVSTVDILL